jgi:hypothetical protein
MWDISIAGPIELFGLHYLSARVRLDSTSILQCGVVDGGQLDQQLGARRHPNQNRSKRSRHWMKRLRCHEGTIDIAISYNRSNDWGS